MSTKCSSWHQSLCLSGIESQQQWTDWTTARVPWTLCCQSREPRCWIGNLNLNFEQFWNCFKVVFLTILYWVLEGGRLAKRESGRFMNWIWKGLVFDSDAGSFLCAINDSHLMYKFASWNILASARHLAKTNPSGLSLWAKGITTP